MAKYKMKTNRSGAKRFKIAAGGRMKRKRAYLRHNTGKRGQNAKRVLRKKTAVHASDRAEVKRLLPNG